MQCSTRGQLTDAFPVQTSVRGVIYNHLSCSFFAVDWIMKQSTSEKKEMKYDGQLDDMEFADDLALLSHTQQQMQEPVQTQSHWGAWKCRSKMSNTSHNLGSVVDTQGGTEADV